MSESVSDSVLNILAKHTELERNKVTPDTPLQLSGVDSLMMVEIIFDLEEHFDISIPDEMLGMQNHKMDTAADVVLLVEELIQQQKSA